MGARGITTSVPLYDGALLSPLRKHFTARSELCYSDDDGIETGPLRPICMLVIGSSVLNAFRAVAPPPSCGVLRQLAQASTVRACMFPLLLCLTAGQLCTPILRPS